MLKNIKVSETLKAVESPKTINTAIEVLSLPEGKTIEECTKILGLAKGLLFSNSNF